MRRLLITGFDPFDGEAVNPSYEAVKLLPDVMGDAELVKICLPTVYGKAAELAMAKIAETSPFAVVCVGQAGGREAVTPEVIGINLREASIPDNEGNLFMGERIDAEGADGIFSTLPVRKMRDAIKEKGLPSKLSYSAGAFVCNDLLYTLLRRSEGSGVKVGFIHVPYLPEQAKQGEPSLALEDIAGALEAALSAVIDEN